VKFSCFKIFSAYILITLLYPDIALSIDIYTSLLLSRIVTSGLFLGVAVSVCTCWFLDMVTFTRTLMSCFILILVHIHITFVSMILPLFPCVCYTVPEHTFYHTYLLRLIRSCNAWLFVCYYSLPVLSDKPRYPYGYIPITYKVSISTSIALSVHYVLQFFKYICMLYPFHSCVTTLICLT
jgi:hypothetical protein